MSDGSIDVLMSVLKKSSLFLAAESATDFAPVSKLTANEQAMREDFQPGYISELREFSFSAGVASELGEDKKKKKAESADDRKTRLDKEKLERDAFQNAVGSAKVMSLKKKREDLIKNKLEKRNSGKLFVDMQPVEFTRLMDKMSPELFKSLVASETIDQIAVIKRKAAGTSSSGEPYLRLDFKKVLLTNLDWKDSDHLLIETGTFIYREVTIKYRPQNPDGTLGPIVFSHWEMKKISAS